MDRVNCAKSQKRRKPFAIPDRLIIYARSPATRFLSHGSFRARAKLSMRFFAIRKTLPPLNVLPCRKLAGGLNCSEEGNSMEEERHNGFYSTVNPRRTWRVCNAEVIRGQKFTVK